MRGRALVPLFVLFIGTAALPLACDSQTDPVPIDIDRKAGCHPLGSTDACMFPFPSFWHEKPDATTATGVRLAIPTDLVPVGSPTLDVAPFNEADGWSPVMPILLHFGVEVDTTDLAGMDSVERSVADDAQIVLLDLESGKKVAHFVEMDANKKDGFDGRYAFIVRPVEPMEMGHRHAVIVKRGLKDTDGKTISSTPAFLALREGLPTTNDDVEGVRDHMTTLFARLELYGYAREDLLTAFDFQVASKDWLLGSVLSMRKEALDVAASGGLGYTIDDVQEDTSDDMAEIVFGTFEVPTYLRDDDSFDYDEQHHPVRQADDRSYPFTMLVPRVAETSTDPLPLVVLGHGIFGNGRDFLTGGDGQAIQHLSQQFGAVVIATDWIGLSSNDLPRIAAEVAPDLNRLPLITDQLQQSLVNVITMTKLAKGKLGGDPMLLRAAPRLVDPSRVYYWGASLGGIQGSSFISISDDISRAAFGVPGSAWSTMLTRSIVFPPVKAFIELDYPDPLDITWLTTMAQLRFDHSDPANMTRLMFKDPLPDAPPDRTVILQEAIGDSQVPNLATDILVRAMGVKSLDPTFYDPFGVDHVLAPTNESCVTQVRLPDWDKPAPPTTNTPPEAENGVHHAMNFEPTVHQQIAALLLDGQIIQPCDGTCDPN
ncbi:MAG TPA: hypothetical protein VL400_23540 [Polyangiaceae bacterium]|nr:hypothetical protein [Polyangiaceae bacterium]